MAGEDTAVGGGMMAVELRDPRPCTLVLDGDLLNFVERLLHTRDTSQTWSWKLPGQLQDAIEDAREQMAAEGEKAIREERWNKIPEPDPDLVHWQGEEG